MNDLEFRQKLLQNPKHLDKNMVMYLEAYPEQKNWVKNLLEMEEQLHQTLEIDVPDDLHDRILMKNAFQYPVQNEVSSWQKASAFVGSFAASVMVLAMVVWFWQAPLNSTPALLAQTAPQNALSQSIVNHIIEHAQEAPEVMTEYSKYDDSELHKLFTKVGATLNKPIDFMSFAGECDVDGHKGLHLVLQEEAGPVTIIVIPGQHMDAMLAFQNSGFEGQMIPVKGAVVAVVGHSYEQLARAQMQFFKAVVFG